MAIENQRTRLYILGIKYFRNYFYVSSNNIEGKSYSYCKPIGIIVKSITGNYI